MTTQIAKITCIVGHRYGRSVIKSIVNSNEFSSKKVEICDFYCLNPYFAGVYGGYDNPFDILEEKSISYKIFDDINDLSDLENFSLLEPDLILVAGLSNRVPTTILNSTRQAREGFFFSRYGGVVGFHPSILPFGAGLSPIQHAIYDTQHEFGVTAFFIDDGAIDSGPIICQESIPISFADTAKELDQKVGKSIALIINKIILKRLISRNFTYYFQNNLESRNVRSKLGAEDRFLDFDCSANDVLRKIRAHAYPYRMAFFFFEQSLVYVNAAKILKTEEPIFDSNIRFDGSVFFVKCADHFIEITDFFTPDLKRIMAKSKL